MLKMRNRIQAFILSGFILITPQLLTGQGVIVKQGGYIRVPAGNILSVKEDMIVHDSKALYNHGVVKVGDDLGSFAPFALHIDTGRVVLDGTAPQTINGTIVIDNLVIDNASGISLINDITVSKTLTFSNGNLILGNHNLLLGPSAQISGIPSNTSMIVATGTGQIRKQFAAPGIFTFPVGDQTGDAEYTPVTLHFTSGTFGNDNYVGVNLVNAKYPDPNIQDDYLNRYWKITTNDVGGYTCNAQFYYKPTDVTGTESKLYCEHVDPPPVAAYDAADPASHVLSASGLTTPGIFTGAGAPCYTLLSSAYVVHDAGCFGGADGSASVTALGGTGTYTYQWLTTPVQETQTATGLPAGSYTVVVTDMLGCSRSSTVTISQPPQWWAGLSGPSSVCQYSTGTVYNTEPGMSNYAWTVSAGGTITSGGTSADNSVMVTWNTAGTQNVSIKYTDVSGCEAVSATSKDVTVVEPGQVDQPASQVVCAGSLTTPVTYSTQSSGGITTYAWTNDNPGIGLDAQGTGDIPAFTAINTGTSPLVSTIVVTPTLTNANVSCTGPAKSFTITVRPSLHRVTIEASANFMCAGTVIGYTATSENGGISPVYQWKVNGVNTGGNIPLFIHTPLNGDVITCVQLSSEPCTGGIPATSNAITMTVRPYNVVSVTISGSANPVCAGSPVTFTAMTVNGGTDPIYQWQVNGTGVGSNSPVYTYNPLSGDQVRCIMTSSVQCAFGNPDTSNTVTMGVTPLLPVSVSITASANPVCANSDVSFTAIPVNGGSNPAYQWKVNTVNVGANTPFYSYVPSDGDIITCKLIANETCMSGNPATSNVISLKVDPLPVPVLTGPVTVISGTTGVGYTTQAGQLEYSWTISAGGTITSGGAPSDHTATVTWNTAGAQWISVNYTNPQTGCHGAAATRLDVTVTQALFISIISPNGGEEWKLGSVHNITWTDNITENVKIELFKEDSYQQTIIATTPSNGTYAWTITGNQEPGTDYRVKITSVADPVLSGMSGSDFSIVYDIPVILEVRDITIASGVIICFDALQTILVAGGGHTFEVQTGGSATFIAGQNILYLPGTTVQPGGYMHGYITTTGQYCWSLPPSIPNTEVVMTNDDLPASNEDLPGRFRVYPNPTDGKFHVEYMGKDKPGTIQVEIFSMKGDKILMETFSGETRHEFTLDGRPIGIYLIRIVTDGSTATVKILKR